MAPYDFTPDKALGYCAEFFDTIKQVIDQSSLNAQFDSDLETYVYAFKNYSYAETES